MQKVLFVLENLGCGGAERVLPNLLKYIDRNKFSVAVLTLFDNGVNSGRIPDDVKVICRKAPYFRGITYITRFLSPEFLYKYYILRAIPEKDFDVIIAYTHGLTTKIISGALSKVKVAWIHGNILGVRKHTIPGNFTNRKRMLEVLSRINAFVGVSQCVCDSFIKFIGYEEKVHLIHNTNDIEEIECKAEEDNPYVSKDRGVEIVTVGHLRKVKGNDLLLEAVAKLKDDGLRFHVTILGDGEEKGRLDAYVRDNGLSEIVSMPGFIENPYPYIKNADLYICPSRSEGFSTAVSEALILGVPVVSTRVSGAEEMLGANDEYGIVCDCSAEGIYGALKRMLATSELLEHYARQALNRREFFEPKRTVGDVERLIDEVVGKMQA